MLTSKTAERITMSDVTDSIVIVVSEKDESTIKEYLPEQHSQSNILYATVLLTILCTLKLSEEDILKVTGFEGVIKFISVPESEYEGAYISYMH